MLLVLYHTIDPISFPCYYYFYVWPCRSRSFCLSDSLCHSVCLFVGSCPSRRAADWQSVDLSVSGTGGLLSQPSSPPPVDRQGQGLILPVSLSSWQPFLRDTNPGQPCTRWHAPSPINIASPFSNLLPQGLLLRVWSGHLASMHLDLPQPASITRKGPSDRLHYMWHLSLAKICYLLRCFIFCTTAQLFHFNSIF